MEENSHFKQRWFGSQIWITVAAVALLCATVFFLLDTMSSSYQRSAAKDSNGRLTAMCSKLARSSAEALGAGAGVDDLDRYFADQAETIIKANPGIVIGLYLPASGRLMLYGNMKAPDHGKDEMPPDDFFFGIKPKTLTSAISRVHLRPDGFTVARAEPVLAGGHVVAVVLAAENRDSSLLMPRAVRRVMYLFFPLMFLVGTVPTLVLLVRFRRGAKRIAGGLERLSLDKSYRLPPSGMAEMEDIVQAINQMADRLEQNARLEEQLERSSRLASLGRLVAGVAHEIRNPLGIIAATVQVMADELKDQGEIREYVDVLKEQIDRQNKIVSELLDYTKPVPANFSPENVNDVVRGVLNLSSPYLKQHSVEIRAELEPHLPTTLLDVERIKQTLLNIIFNAVEAMPEGGQLSLKTSTAGDDIVVEITDTGRGIAPHDIKKVFDPFYTTKHTGTGLGLANALQNVEMHGGTIDVESRGSLGTSFKIHLPITETGRDVG